MSLSFANYKKFIIDDEQNNLDLYDLVQEISFVSSELKRIQKSIVKFKNVKIMNLSKNKLSSLPKEIIKMQSIKSLILTDNEFETLPEEICSLANLKNLIVISNKLKSLPNNIGNLKNLELLWVCKNEIQSLPDSFYTLTSLKEFRASENKISQLGDLSNLTNLKRIYLDHNLLEQIPEQIVNLTNLVRLDISYNLTKSSNFAESNEQIINDIFNIESLEYFKNDFNLGDKFCSICKKETNTTPPCGHYICPICANKKMLQKFNDNYETTCPTCNQIFKTNELKEDDDKFMIKINKCSDETLCENNLNKCNSTCKCANC